MVFSFHAQHFLIDKPVISAASPIIVFHFFPKEHESPKGKQPYSLPLNFYNPVSVF